MNRRAFLTGSGCLAVGFLVGCSIPPIPDRPEASAEDATGWIIREDGRYRLLLPRTEMGQGIATALKQVACQGLDVDWEQVTVELADTSAIPGFRSTVGSESIRDYAVPLARACTAMKQAVANGQTSGRVAGSLVENLPDTVPKAGRYVGKYVLAEGHRDIVTGAPLFAADMRLKGMIYGRVLRAPLSPEIKSSPVSWNTEAARRDPSFVGVYQSAALTQGNAEGLGIVAETPGALDRIEAALKVQWTWDEKRAAVGIAQMMTGEGRLDGSPDNTVVNAGDMPDGKWDIDLRFDIPFAAHHPIEPRSAVADIKPGQAKVWAGTQDPFYVRKAVTDRLDLDAADLVVQPMRVGGAFGGKTLVTVEIEAAVLSHLSERPVKVQWTREQELRQAHHRPRTNHRVRARLAGQRLSAWQHKLVSGHVIFTNAALPAWMQSLTDFIGDSGAGRGAAHDYDMPNALVGYDLERLPVLTGPWRGLGAAPNNFAIECAIDACASLAGMDPIAFRLAHIRNPRLAGVLKAVQTMAGTVSGNPRIACGVACGIYKKDSFVAVIAEIQRAQDGSARLTHLWSAHDCGQVINPDQVRAQCEGNLVWGLGMLNHDRLTYRDGRIQEVDFAMAPIPSIDTVPPMSIGLIDSDAQPSGAGETAIVAGAAAVANAIASVSGTVPTQLPLDPAQPVWRT